MQEMGVFSYFKVEHWKYKPADHGYEMKFERAGWECVEARIAKVGESCGQPYVEVFVIFRRI